MANKVVGVIMDEQHVRIMSSEKGKIFDDLSLVCWNKLTKEIVLSGKDVKNSIGRLDDPLVISEFLSNYTIQSLEIFKAYLEMIVDEFKNDFCDADVVFSCPNIKNNYIQELANILIVEKAKASTINFVPKIILSAIGVGAEIDEDYGVLVLDIDYARACVALILNGEIYREKETNYAKKSLDDSIIQHFKEEHQIVINDESVEKIKWSIGTIIKLKDELEIAIVGKDIFTNERKVVICKSEDSKKIFIKLFTYYKSLITNVLELSDPIVRSGVIKNGLFITGELSAIIGVKDFFEDFFNFPVTVSKKTGYSASLGSLKYSEK